MSTRIFAPVAAAVVLASVPADQAHSALITLNISNASITVGKSFDVQVLADSEGLGEELLAFGLDVGTSNGVVTYSGYSVGPGFIDISDPLNPSNVSGLAFPGIGDNTVLLATLLFTSTATGAETISVNGLYDGLFYGLFYETTGIDIFQSVNVTANHVPEPATLALFGLGVAGIGWRRRRQYA